MIIEIDIECQECNATYQLKHDLNTSRYMISCCPFCGSDNIEMEEDYDEDESWD
tara:strand:+ start:1019 stop:1180 length:162 start_codon:yes stop_codon:yes gene_type:complete